MEVIKQCEGIFETNTEKYMRTIVESLCTLNTIKTIELALEEYKAGLMTPDEYLKIKSQAMDIYKDNPA